MAQPLNGLRVVELAEGVAGPYAGKLLADYGADVVKVERPDGDPARHVGPFPEGGGADPERSALFLHLNTNKRSVSGVDRNLIDELMGWGDIVIQSRPEPDPAELRERFPHLVVTSVTPFGLTGPYAGFAGEEIVHYAFGGPMSASGAPDREPLKMGGAIGQYQCGTVAAVASLAGLMLAERGRGVHIDLANTETQVGSIDRRMTYLLFAAYRQENVARTAGYNLSPMPNGCRPTLDGHIQISTLMNWIPRMLAVVGDDDLAAVFQDPNFFFDEAVPEMVDAHTLAWTLTKTRQEAMEEAQAGGWPVTAVNRPVDLLTDDHFEKRGFFVPVDHPVAGTVRQPGAPIRIDDGWRLRRPAPTLGQHTDEVTADIGAADARAIDDEPSGPVDRPPLDGIRVLDMTVVWAGPYATCILGDLGAEIVRVDNPHIFPSATRGLMPRPPKELLVDANGIFGGYPDAEPGDRPWNRVALFNAHARNKKSLTLDLRKDAGREAFLRLADTCDLMIENNSVDLLEKLGIDWETLHERNPRLILIRMPSVGLTGPYRSYLGFGVNFEGLCGLTAIRGYADVDHSESETVFHMDAASGSSGAFAALMALRRREHTGVGEMIELSQSENMLNHVGELLIDAERTGREHGPLGNRHHARAPQGCYPCAVAGVDDEAGDGWVVISVGDDDEWAGLGRAAGSPVWAADERFATAEGRRVNHDDLDELISSWTATSTAHEVFLACQAEGVPAAPVLHELEALADPHLTERGMFRPNGNDEIGTHTYPAHLWRWDGPDLAWGPIPVLGGHNEHVLRELVGLTEEEYDDLAADAHLSLDYLDPEGNPL